MRKIIVDTGWRGADALSAELARGRLEISGVCVSPDAENYEDVCAAVRAKVKSAADIPVYAGAVRPLLNADFIRGKRCPQSDTERNLRPGIRADFMIDCANRCDETEIICLGPLSNIALAVMKDETAMKKVKRIYVAGGALLGYCATTPTSEYNMLADAEAAQKVFASGIPVTLVPVHICRDAAAAVFDVARGARCDTWQAYLSVDTSLGFTRGQTVIDLVGRNPINGETVSGEKQTVVTAIK